MSRFFTLMKSCLVVWVVLCTSSAMLTASPKLLKRDIVFAHIFFKPDFSRNRFTACVRLRIRTSKNQKNLELHLSEALQIDTLLRQMMPAAFQRKGKRIIIHTEKDSSHEVKLVYSGKIPLSERLPWEGGFKIVNDSLRPALVGLACQAEGASLWLPLTDYWSDKIDTAIITIAHPKYVRCIANGTLQSSEMQSDGTLHTTWRTQYPILPYNITFYLGEYIEMSDTVVLSNNRPLFIQSFFTKKEGDKKRKAQHHYSHLVKQLDSLFAPYPFFNEGLKIIEAPYLGMEHQTAIAYGDKYNLNAFGFDFIMLHETAHEYWGNRISACEESDMWIHESLATYTEALYVLRTQGEKAYERYLTSQKSLIDYKVPLAPKPLGKSPSSNDMYYKGAHMWHTLTAHLDTADRLLFFKKLYANLSDYACVNTKVIMHETERILNRPVINYMKPCIYEAQLPTLYFRNTSDGMLYWYTSNQQGNDLSPMYIFLKSGERVRCENQQVRLKLNDVDWDAMRSYYLWTIKAVF